MTTRWRSRCAGVSVPEALVALLLGLLVLHLTLDTTARIRSAQNRLATSADGLVALRVGHHLLRRELRLGRPGRDWALDQDSLSIRAFRGTALVCPADSAAIEVVVSYRGDRAPDPSKDSLLLFGADGASTVRALEGEGGAAPGVCSLVDAGKPASWRLDAEVPAGIVLARLFERGSYHLSGSALRYRRGLSGRQPLTPEVWSAATAWQRSDSRLGLEVVPEDPDASRPWSGFLSWMAP